MKVIVKEVHKQPEVRVIRDDINKCVKDIQNIIGGYMEVVPTEIPGVVFFCNENGKFENLPVNFYVETDDIRGNVCFVNTHGEDIIDLTEEQIEEIKVLYENI